MELHKTVYQHKTSGAIKLMMLDVFILAKDHLKFYGKDGKDYTLTNAFEDVDAYLQIDNTITTIVSIS
jgi:HD superfamily phosphohydrolase